MCVTERRVQLIRDPNKLFCYQVYSLCIDSVHAPFIFLSHWVLPSFVGDSGTVSAEAGAWCLVLFIFPLLLSTGRSCSCTASDNDTRSANRDRQFGSCRSISRRMFVAVATCRRPVFCPSRLGDFLCDAGNKEQLPQTRQVLYVFPYHPSCNIVSIVISASAAVVR